MKAYVAAHALTATLKRVPGPPEPVEGETRCEVADIEAAIYRIPYENP